VKGKECVTEQAENNEKAASDKEAWGH